MLLKQCTVRLKTFCHVWVLVLNLLNTIILVVCIVPTTVLAGDCSMELPEIVLVDIDVKAL